MFNIGLDLTVWVWAGLALISVTAFAIFAVQAFNLVAVLKRDASQSYYHRSTMKKAIWRVCLTGLFGVLLLLFMFGAYGAGTAPEMSSGSGEAIHEDVPPPPTKKQLEKDSKKKVDPELKKQRKHHKRVEDPSDKKERDEADRYEKEALDRSRRK